MYICIFNFNLNIFRRQNEDGSEVYWANVYRLSNSWTVKITAVKETNEEGQDTWNTKVMQVKEDGTEEEVKPYDVRSFKKNNQSTRKMLLEFIKETCEVATKVLETYNAGREALENTIPNVDENADE